MKDEEFWNPDAIIKDCLFETNMSITQIADELDWSSYKTSQRIKQLGLAWVKRNNRKMSRGQAALKDIMQKLLPGEEVVQEYPIGERLRLDLYCPSYSLAAEYHGRQHFFYSDLFYNSSTDFEQAQKRDDRKEYLCRYSGIALVVFRFNDELTDEAVFIRMMNAIRSTPYLKEEKPKVSFRGNHFYEKMKVRNRDYRKQKYREMKKKRNG